jgi:hypothetical protein
MLTKAMCMFFSPPCLSVTIDACSNPVFPPMTAFVKPFKGWAAVGQFYLQPSLTAVSLSRSLMGVSYAMGSSHACTQ